MLIEPEELQKINKIYKILVHALNIKDQMRLLFSIGLCFSKLFSMGFTFQQIISLSIDKGF